jgi:hypothetical protein
MRANITTFVEFGPSELRKKGFSKFPGEGLA